MRLTEPRGSCVRIHLGFSEVLDRGRQRRVCATLLEIELKGGIHRSPALRWECEQPMSLSQIMDSLAGLQLQDLLNFAATEQAPKPLSPNEIRGCKKRAATPELSSVKSLLIAVQTERDESSSKSTTSLCRGTAHVTQATASGPSRQARQVDLDVLVGLRLRAVRFETFPTWPLLLAALHCHAARGRGEPIESRGETLF